MLAACNTPSGDPDAAAVQVVGHGGSGFETVFRPLPANTRESIAKAISDGGDGVEMDIQLSKDDQVVVFHDKELDKKTNCSGHLRDFTLREITACDFNGDYPRIENHTHHIDALSDILNMLDTIAQGKWIYLNVKPCPSGDRKSYNEVMSSALVQLIRQHQITTRAIVETSDMELLQMIAAKDAEVIIMQDTGLYADDIQQVLENHFDGIVIDKDDITADQVKEAQVKGLKVIIYGLKTRTAIRNVLKMHPDAVQTDRVGLTLDLRN